jgi:hypothetical protein
MVPKMRKKKHSKRTGIWKFRNSMIWDSRKTSFGEFTGMDIKTLLLFSKKVSCLSFRARTPLPRLNQELEKLVHLQLASYRALITKLSTAKHWSLLPLVNCPCKSPMLSIQLENSVELKCTLALEVLLFVKISKFLKREFKLWLEHQDVYMT